MQPFKWKTANLDEEAEEEEQTGSRYLECLPVSCFRSLLELILKVRSSA